MRLYAAVAVSASSFVSSSALLLAVMPLEMRLSASMAAAASCVTLLSQDVTACWQFVMHSSAFWDRFSRTARFPVAVSCAAAAIRSWTRSSMNLSTEAGSYCAGIAMAAV